jgi:hypothetical protein
MNQKGSSNCSKLLLNKNNVHVIVSEEEGEIYDLLTLIADVVNSDKVEDDTMVIEFTPPKRRISV